MVQLQGSARLEPPWDRSILVCKSHQICNFCHNSTWSRQVIRFKDCNSMRSKWCLALWVQSQRTFPQEVQVDWAWLDSITILVSKMLMCHCNDMQRQNSKKGTCPNMGSQSPWIELLMACCHHQTYHSQMDRDLKWLCHTPPDENYASWLPSLKPFSLESFNMSAGQIFRCEAKPCKVVFWFVYYINWCEIWLSRACNPKWTPKCDHLQVSKQASI